MVTTICGLTGVKLSLEDPIRKGEYNECPNEAYKLVSGKSMEDFTLWMADLTFVKVFILEMKTEQTVNQHAVCQAIGYNMASKTESVTSDGKKIPALAMVLSQTLIFLPYYELIDGEPISCINAIVGGMYQWERAEEETLSYLVTFIVAYILSIHSCVPIHETSAKKRTTLNLLFIFMKLQILNRENW